MSENQIASNGNFVYPKDRNKYELMENIASGASAEVLTARCSENGEIIAIKRIDLKKTDISYEDLLVSEFKQHESNY